MVHEIIEAGIMGILSNQRSGFAPGGEVGAKENLTGIDIAETSYNTLIEQGSFQRGRFFSECSGEILTTEFIAKGLHADILQELVTCQFIFMKKVHDAKAAMIGVNNPHAIIESEDHMVMGACARVNRSFLKIEFSQIVGLLPAAQDRKPPGHAEMHQKAMAIIKVNQNIFSTAAQA